MKYLIHLPESCKHPVQYKDMEESHIVDGYKVVLRPGSITLPHELIEGATFDTWQTIRHLSRRNKQLDQIRWMYCQIQMSHLGEMWDYVDMDADAFHMYYIESGDYAKLCTAASYVYNSSCSDEFKREVYDYVNADRRAYERSKELELEQVS